MIRYLPSRRLRHLARLHGKYARRPRRYRHLIAAAAARAPRRILEIGVFTGQRGIEMIEASQLGGGGQHYRGFDLFEQMNAEILAAELSKTPDQIAAVERKLSATGAEIKLYPGWSEETLPALAAAEPAFRADLIFIDGGHAVKTIATDWALSVKLLAPGGVLFLDDYYVDCPHLTNEFGCNTLIAGLDRAEWQVTLHADVDRFEHGGLPHNVAIVEVSRV